MPPRFLVSVMPSEEQEAAAREAAAKPAEEEAAPGQAVEVSPPGGGARAVVLKGHRNAKSIRVELRPGMDKSKVGGVTPFSHPWLAELRGL